MIKRNKTNPYEPETNHDKYMIDLNDSQYQSPWRLLALFQYAASNDLNLSSSTIRSALQEMNDKQDPEKMIKVMDKYMKDIAIFYWGPGDNSDDVEDIIQPYKESKTVNTQENLEENKKKYTKRSK